MVGACTPGAQLAGFIKRTTIHCYTQNRKALCLVVLEIFFPIVSLWERGAIFGRIYKEDHYTLLHTKYERISLWFRRFFLCFSHDGRIYREDHSTLLHTKYESSGPCGFGDFFIFVSFFIFFYESGSNLLPWKPEF